MPDASMINYNNIEEIENIWIELPDGCRLAARLWLPENSRAHPVPAIFEYLPYRKRDFMRRRDEGMHRYYAARGYASVRVDIRGSGDSAGILHDEYSQQEHADAVEVIAWIARQKWCSGAVGMTGISWGGINALQIAALQPPALKAIITLCSTDDRYADDAHYMGGCLLNENMQWGSMLMMTSAYPPDPEIAGTSWRDRWKERLEQLEPFPANWMRHPWRDEFWQYGSVCEDFDAVKIPVYAIGGWADGYSNAVPRLLAGLRCPRKGLIGPWAHSFPHDARPGPSIGYLQEAVRWWDQWLREEETGIMAEPLYRVWMQEHVRPQPQYDEWPGRWVAEGDWPNARIKPAKHYLNPGQLDMQAEAPTEVSFTSPQTTGGRGGEWCAFGADGEMPRDQRPDDGGSLLFDSDPLDARLELLGAPVLELDIKSDQPLATLAARLCDVAPDGTSLRVSYGLLNLCHRDSHEFPEPLIAGKWYRIRIQLNDLAHAFAPGHRIRIALSTSYWPIAWPSPRPVLLTVRTGNSTLNLPVRTPCTEDEVLLDFLPPVSAPIASARKIHRYPMRRTVEIDLASNETVYTLRSDGGEFDGAILAHLEDIGLDLGYYLMKRYRMIEDDPLSASTELFQRTILKRDDWSVRIESRARLTATDKHFQFSCDLETFEGNRPFVERSWAISIPRKLV